MADIIIHMNDVIEISNIYFELRRKNKFSSDNILRFGIVCCYFLSHYYNTIAIYRDVSFYFNSQSIFLFFYLATIYDDQYLRIWIEKEFSYQLSILAGHWMRNFPFIQSFCFGLLFFSSVHCNTMTNNKFSVRKMAKD